MTSQNKRKKAFIEFFKKCIENGADIHKKDVYGMDALLFSVSREHEELIKILIEYGADIKTISSNYSNVLHIANSANVKLIKLLIENGAHKVLNDIKKGTQTTAGLMTPGYTPIMCAINYNDENVLYYLSLGADVNHMTEDGISFWSLLYQKIKYDPNDKFIEQVKNYLGENRVEENMKKEKNKERLHNLFK
jgi:ankyrin repeat protein